MKTQKAQNDPQRVLEEMERERKEMEDMFTIKAGEVEKLREKDVLSKRVREALLAAFLLPIMIVPEEPWSNRIPLYF